MGVGATGSPDREGRNATGPDSFARKGKPAGSADRIAISIAAGGDKDCEIVRMRGEDTGFDAA
ncbi:hypothetical protein GV67_21990 [Pseudorhizobium pelagicum]|nr:hypothetical protein GV67_21990 [Pseudorhizobium pelagicum]